MFNIFKTSFDPTNPQQEIIISLLDSNEESNIRLAKLMLRKKGLSSTSIRNYLRDYVFYLIFRNIKYQPGVYTHDRFPFIMGTLRGDIYQFSSIIIVSNLDMRVRQIKSITRNSNDHTIRYTLGRHLNPDYESDCEKYLTKFIYTIANNLKNT